MLEVQKLYPQYITVKDRRKQEVSVPFERRSGVERRNDERVTLDTNLTRDIFEVKNKISQLSKTNPVTFAQDISKATSNSIKADQFIKTKHEKPIEPVKKSDDLPSATSLMAGILGVALCGTVASVFMGTAGAIVALGFGAYLGAKILKQVIVSHMVEDGTKNRNKRNK